MSDFDLDWGMEHELHVDHDGGVDHVTGDQHYGHQGQQDFSDGTESGHDVTDAHFFGDLGDSDHGADTHDEPAGFDEPELPEWQLDADFMDGHYDLVGADPDENDMWAQFMTDMHEEVNPYAAN
jgi:hypothetical protein